MYLAPTLLIPKIARPMYIEIEKELYQCYFVMLHFKHSFIEQWHSTLNTTLRFTLIDLFISIHNIICNVKSKRSKLKSKVIQ